MSDRKPLLIETYLTNVCHSLDVIVTSLANTIWSLKVLKEDIQRYMEVIKE